MKNKLRYLLLVIGILGLLVGCGGDTTADLSSEGNTQEDVEYYTVIFDKNTTSDDLTDDETFTYFSTGWNAEKKSSVVQIEKTDDAYIPMEDVPTPTRKGYYFAGWQTKPVIEDTDIVHGVSKYQVFFDTKLTTLALQQLEQVSEEEKEYRDIYQEAFYIKDFENLTEDGTLTLYARWVEQTEIDSEEDLKNIKNDLYGAYILTSDITLTEAWEPIGAYYSNYEFYNNDWWTYAFRGSFDGNGHTIYGLNIQSATHELPDWVLDEEAIWYADGNDGNGTAALFAAISDAEIKNLTLESPVISITGENTYTGHFLYAAAVASFDMESSIRNVNVNNPIIQLEYSDVNISYEDEMYISIGGVEAGGWSSSIKNCNVTNGTIILNEKTIKRHGGEIYAGGLIGEGFAGLDNNKVDVAITINGEDVSTAEQDSVLKVWVGGLTGTSTTSKNNTINADIAVNVVKPVGKADVNVGGIAGAQRYQKAEQNEVIANIITNCKLDENEGNTRVGAAVGFFDIYYAVIVLEYSTYIECGTAGNDLNVTWNGNQYNVLMPEEGYPVLDGKKISYIAVKDTEMDGASYASNVDELLDVYGGYITSEHMVDALMLIKME